MCDFPTLIWKHRWHECSVKTGYHKFTCVISVCIMYNRDFDDIIFGGVVEPDRYNFELTFDWSTMIGHKSTVNILNSASIVE